MPLRRTLATTAAVLLSAPLLASCGFNLSTDRVNENTAGGQDRTGIVDVLAAVVVAGQPDAGTFIANFSNNDQEKPHSVTSIEGASGGTGGTADTADIDEITIPPGGFVNLAQDGGVKLTGDFDAGDILRLSIGLDDGETVLVDVPVVRACDEYVGLDPAASESSTPSAGPTDAPETVDASGAASGAPSASDSAGTTGGSTDEGAGQGIDEGTDEATAGSTSSADATVGDDPTDEVTLPTSPSPGPTRSRSASASSSPSATPSAYACGYASIGSLPDNIQQSE